MSVIDKLKFWKKKEEEPELGKLDIPDFGHQLKSAMDVPSEEFGKPVTTTQYGRAPFPEHEMTTLRESAPNVPRYQQWQGYKESSEMEIISAKLDALKAALDTINQRLANLERIAEGEQPRRWQYR